MHCGLDLHWLNIWYGVIIGIILKLYALLETRNAIRSIVSIWPGQIAEPITHMRYYGNRVYSSPVPQKTPIGSILII